MIKLRILYIPPTPFTTHFYAHSIPLINHNFSWESKLNDTGVDNKTCYFFFWKHRMEPVNYQPENYRFCLEVLEMTHMTEGSSCLRYYDALRPKIEL